MNSISISDLPISAHSFRRNVSSTLIGNFVYTLCQWGMLTSLAQLGSPHMVGQYAWSLAITAPILILSSLSLREVLVTDATDQFTFYEYVSLRVAANSSSVLVLLIMLLLISPDKQTVLLTMVVGATKAIEAVSDIIYGYFQKHEVMLPIAKSMVLRGVFNLTGFATILWWSNSVILAALGASVASAVMLAFYDVPLLRAFQRRKKVARQFRRNRLVRARLWWLLKISVPLGLAASMISLNFNVSRYFLGAAEGNATLGIYSVLAYPTIAGNLVIAALANASLPRLSQLFATDDWEAFAQLLGKLMALAVVLGVVATLLAWWLGAFVLESLFGPEYAAESFAFVLLMAGTGFGFVSWFLNSALSAARLFQAVFVLQIFALIATVLLSWWLIPRDGLIGAAWVSILVTVAGVVLKVAVLIHPRYRTRGTAIGAPDE